MSAAVLVESFQPGVSVEQFIRRPAPFNTQVPFAALPSLLGCILTHAAPLSWSSFMSQVLQALAWACTKLNQS